MLFRQLMLAGMTIVPRATPSTRNNYRRLVIAAPGPLGQRRRIIMLIREPEKLLKAKGTI
ncbi:MAG: hypothetical protein GX244_02055 [Firmicutes bacterium]|nr:hypothetical protein [Bacillota bacterium]